MKKQFLFLSTLTILSGCTQVPTPYQPIKNNEGYSSRKVGENMYEIQVRGNQVTTHPTLVKHLYRHAEELCGSSNYDCDLAESHYSHFQDAHVQNHGTGVTYYTPNRVSALPYVFGMVHCH